MTIRNGRKPDRIRTAGGKTAKIPPFLRSYRASNENVPLLGFNLYFSKLPPAVIAPLNPKI